MRKATNILTPLSFTWGYHSWRTPLLYLPRPDESRSTSACCLCDFSQASLPQTTSVLHPCQYQWIKVFKAKSRNRKVGFIFRMLRSSKVQARLLPLDLTHAMKDQPMNMPMAISIYNARFHSTKVSLLNQTLVKLPREPFTTRSYPQPAESRYFKGSCYIKWTRISYLGTLISYAWCLRSLPAFSKSLHTLDLLCNFLSFIPPYWLTINPSYLSYIYNWTEVHSKLCIPYCSKANKMSFCF